MKIMPHHHHHSIFFFFFLFSASGKKNSTTRGMAGAQASHNSLQHAGHARAGAERAAGEGEEPRASGRDVLVTWPT